jgi:hypothetical protein
MRFSFETWDLEAKRAYIAGFFDGEGSFRASARACS